MTAPVVNLTFEQGATFVHRFTYLDLEGDPVVLGDYTAQMYIRETVDALETLLELTTENGMIVLGTGTVDLEVTDTAVDELMEAVGENDITLGSYDLKLTDPSSGRKIRLVQGQITFSRECSHD